MIVPRLIERKRDGGRLEPREIRELVLAYAADRIPDYQMAALLMAIYFEGLDREEMNALMEAMLESGDRLDLARLPLPRIDKHVWVLDTAVTLAPLMGLLGTIVGMVHAFDILGTSGTGGAATKMVTGGIAEALVATGAGLLIAIIAVLFLNHFNKRIRLALHQMDLLKVMVINRFYGGGSVHQGVPVKEALAANVTGIKTGRAS